LAAPRSIVAGSHPHWVQPTGIRCNFLQVTLIMAVHVILTFKILAMHRDSVVWPQSLVTLHPGKMNNFFLPTVTVETSVCHSHGGDANSTLSHGSLVSWSSRILHPAVAFRKIPFCQGIFPGSPTINI
jgi:hypothetical protein